MIWTCEKDHIRIDLDTVTIHYESHPRHENVNSHRYSQVRAISDMVLEPYLLEQTPRVVFDTTISREILSSSVYRIHKIHLPFPTSDLSLSVEGIFILHRFDSKTLVWNTPLWSAAADQASFINTMQKLTSFRTSLRGFGFRSFGFRSFAVISLIRWMILEKYSRRVCKLVREQEIKEVLISDYERKRTKEIIMQYENSIIEME